VLGTLAEEHPWPPGNLAKTATHASVFAQLLTADGECHGLHNFIVAVR
jgi:acyl-CoA oxidase